MERAGNHWEPLRLHQLEGAALSRWARMYQEIWKSLRFGVTGAKQWLQPINVNCDLWRINVTGQKKQKTMWLELFTLSTYDCCKLFGTLWNHLISTGSLLEIHAWGLHVIIGVDHVLGSEKKFTCDQRESCSTLVNLSVNICKQRTVCKWLLGPKKVSGYLA